MKRLFGWQVRLGIIFLGLSVLTYYIHYRIFHDLHHIFIYLVGDIAFVFLEVLLVTMVIHGVLTSREKQALLKKLNMVIGVFFSEVGTALMGLLSAFETAQSVPSAVLLVRKDWTDRDFSRARSIILKHAVSLECRRTDMQPLKAFLSSKRHFLLMLLENPNLLEHEDFTNLLWAVFHLAEELGHRANVNKLTDKDAEHLSGDMKRVYTLLFAEWLSYMQHLHKNYPYLFSLALRTNPFDPQAKVEVE